MSSQETVNRIPAPPESTFKEGDRVAKTWFIFAALWFRLFASFGLLLAIKFFWPTGENEERNRIGVTSGPSRVEPPQ